MKKVKYFAAMDDGTREDRRGYLFDIVECRNGWRALTERSRFAAFRVCVSKIGGAWVPTEQTTGYALPPYSAHTMIGALHVVCVFAPEIVRALESKRRADNREACL